MIKKIAILLICLIPLVGWAKSVIRINQLGYLPNSVKVAVYLNDNQQNIDIFQVVNPLTGKIVFEGSAIKEDATFWGQASAYRLNFSDLKQSGGFVIKVVDAISPSFKVGSDVYDGTADFVLNYMRQQRCGFNPFLNDSCHTHDGVIVDHPTKTGEHIDVTGGWHDASDYLQYTTTSANAVYQLLFAYQQNPQVYQDFYDANGKKGTNGIPDILDEARWGLEWLIKMNPAKNEMYNQIADDRDHRGGYRMPKKDTVTYELGDSRPVYFVTGKSQGLKKHKNRTTGVSSTAAKFASSFALGATIFREFDKKLSEKMSAMALEAWDFAKSDLGNCQTACVVSPYFYEEDNYVDDMELAAATLMNERQSAEFQKEANYWGVLEPVTPWMELHRARHYQFYPFVNLGHSLLAQSKDSVVSKQYIALMKQGLGQLKHWSEGDPFQIGVPFIWCSNNLVVAAATQARLYREISGDKSFEEMEAALTDWLFGCNPWGTSMICGLPAGGDNPQKPHSSITKLLGETTIGGLVDGPVYKTIYESLIGIQLLKPDEYADFQKGKVVYHDDIGDYSTNEPTMDGTASLSYLLSSLENRGSKVHEVKDSQGATVGMDVDKPIVYLVFTADEFADGGKVIAQTLKKNKAKGSFFFTGNFYENPQNKAIVERLIADGHYLGAHSDQHLLYCDWTKRDSILVDKEVFSNDLKANYSKMAKFGIQPENATFFLPPYEWYNDKIVDWSKSLGLKLINFTQGVRTNSDYTTPDMPNYKSSEFIINDLKTYEKSNPHGLNGAIILIHFGTAPERTDKLYNRLDEILQYFKKNGYQTARF